jgi:hypothetical protein
MVKLNWTRRSAIVFLLAISGVAAVLPAIGATFTTWSHFAASAATVLTIATSLIAYLGIPPSPKADARIELDRTIGQYVVLQGLGGSAAQKNRAINRMRELSGRVRYSSSEISHCLNSLSEGERVAGLAIVQWQWGDRTIWEKISFVRLKNIQELPPPPAKRLDVSCFTSLLNLLCNSYDKFENYHATVAMWGMLKALEPPQYQSLVDKVVDSPEGTIYNTCDEWGLFVAELKKARQVAEIV